PTAALQKFLTDSCKVLPHRAVLVIEADGAAGSGPRRRWPHFGSPSILLSARSFPMTTQSWIHHLFARKPRTVRKAPARCRPAVEALEARLAPATYDVPSLADDGSAGTLRWAINQANATPSQASTINLDVTSFAMGHPTIQLSGSQLPMIQCPLTIWGD